MRTDFQRIFVNLRNTVQDELEMSEFDTQGIDYQGVLNLLNNVNNVHVEDGIEDNDDIIMDEDLL